MLCKFSKGVSILNIAIFTDTFYPQINGVTNTFGHLSKYLDQNHIEHIFFAPEYDEVDYDKSRFPVIRFKGIAPHIYPECRLAYPLQSRVVKELNDFQPDVVHIATEFGVGLSGLRAARELHLPIVMSYHTNYNQYLNFYNLNFISNAVWSYLRWFHSFAEVNLCPSENTLKQLEKLGFSGLDIWSRGIDLEQFNPDYRSDRIRSELGDGKTIFLYVGRISVEKGLDTLVESIRIVNETHKDDVAFVFTGDGPYLQELSSLGIPNTVFTGAKHGRELAAIYASSDVFVFPSGTETFGNVMLEAMASGLPGICVDSGGVTDYAVHHENAFVCNYRDAASLADAMIQMLNPALREKIRQGAIETAKQRSWDTIFDGLMAHYESVAQKAYQVQKMAR